jgi:hypothetical protein
MVGRIGIVLVAVTALAVGGVASAAVAAEPTAITGAVTSLGATTATVSGTVNAGGQATTWWVEYGTSTSYGSRTAAASAGSGTSNTQVSASFSGLSPGTTYHYRVVASNAAGTSRGGDGIFTTAAPPVAVTNPASDVGTTTARLNGSVDPNGRATTWYFEFGPTTAYGSRTPERSAGSGGTATAVSVALSGLTRGRLYHFRLVATSDAGTSRGADRSFTMGGAPGAVTDAASSVSPTKATLNGRVSPNGETTRWWFEYGTTTRYGSRTAIRTTSSAERVRATISNLRRDTTYHFRLVAANDAGTAVGADRMFSTALTPGLGVVTSRDVGTTTATLAGSVDPRGRSTAWWFEYGTTTRYGSRTPSRSAGSGHTARAVAATLSGLTAGTVYHFRLVARNGFGTTHGADATFTTVGVTLAAPAQRVVFGRRLMLSGTVPTRRAGEVVTVLAQVYGRDSFESVASVTTAADGSWRYLARPRIRTAYAVSWERGRSAAFVVAVRPALSLRRTASGTLLTRASGIRSFAGRTVQLQRRTAGRWRTIARLRLNRRSSAVFRTLPRGTSTLRVAMSVNQAGPGYLAGFSRTLVVRR